MYVQKLLSLLIVCTVVSYTSLYAQTDPTLIAKIKQLLDANPRFEGMKGPAKEAPDEKYGTFLGAAGTLSVPKAEVYVFSPSRFLDQWNYQIMLSKKSAYQAEKEFFDLVNDIAMALDGYIIEKMKWNYPTEVNIIKKGDPNASWVSIKGGMMQDRQFRNTIMVVQPKSFSEQKFVNIFEPEGMPGSKFTVTTSLGKVVVERPRHGKWAYDLFFEKYADDKLENVKIRFSSTQEKVFISSLRKIDAEYEVRDQKIFLKSASDGTDVRVNSSAMSRQKANGKSFSSTREAHELLVKCYADLFDVGQKISVDEPAAPIKPNAPIRKYSPRPSVDEKINETPEMTPASTAYAPIKTFPAFGGSYEGDDLQQLLGRHISDPAIQQWFAERQFRQQPACSARECFFSKNGITLLFKYEHLQEISLVDAANGYGSTGYQGKLPAGIELNAPISTLKKISGYWSTAGGVRKIMDKGELRYVVDYSNDKITRFSLRLKEDIAADAKEEIRNDQVGVGLVLEDRDGKVKIKRKESGWAAAASQISSFSEIVSIDGVSAKGKSAAVLDKMIRGKLATPVKIETYRSSAQDTIIYTLYRGAGGDFKKEIKKDFSKKKEVNPNAITFFGDNILKNLGLPVDASEVQALEEKGFTFNYNPFDSRLITATRKSGLRTYVELSFRKSRPGQPLEKVTFKNPDVVSNFLAGYVELPMGLQWGMQMSDIQQVAPVENWTKSSETVWKGRWGTKGWIELHFKSDGRGLSNVIIGKSTY